MEYFRQETQTESTDSYDKAKQDVLQAVDSVRRLSAQQQRMLAEELMGVTNAAVLLNLLSFGLRR